MVTRVLFGLLMMASGLAFSGAELNAKSLLAGPKQLQPDPVTGNYAPGQG